MNNDELSILRKIEKEKQINQRKIASELGISLGKVNYCLKELKKRGFIKINNFSQSKKN